MKTVTSTVTIKGAISSSPATILPWTWRSNLFGMEGAAFGCLRLSGVT